MSPDIISVYTKVWTSGFSVTFLHDSAHCIHCLNGGINITSRVKDTSTTQDDDSPEKEEAPKSFMNEARLQSVVVKHDSIPENCFSPLGIKVTAAVVAKLKRDNELKTSKVATACKKSSLQTLSSKKNFTHLERPTRTCDTSCTKDKKYSKAKNKDGLRKALYKKILSTVTQPVVKVSRGIENKKHTIPNKKPKLPSKLKTVKEPSKGTLKRKRWQMDKLKQSNASYEDDLFENQKCCNFKSMMEDDSDSEKYDKMLTPKISLSPVREGSKSPIYDDCYSPNELFINRKEAEEYIFRREKRRKIKLQDERSGSDETSPEKYKNTDEFTTRTLEAARKILTNVALKEEDSDSEEEKDDYFSDVSD